MKKKILISCIILAIVCIFIIVFVNKNTGKTNNSHNTELPISAVTNTGNETDMSKLTLNTSFKWGDQRDWPFGEITEITTEENKTVMNVSHSYFIHKEDSIMVS